MKIVVIAALLLLVGCEGPGYHTSPLDQRVRNLERDKSIHRMDAHFDAIQRDNDAFYDALGY